MKNIKMLGIDHSKANIEQRELFSFTTKECAQVMEAFVRRDGILGCIIISTCNRLEVWLSCEAEYENSIYEELCNIKKVSPKAYRSLFVMRAGREAVNHLFQLSSGVKSKIIGEDQIITQVKEALRFSREHYCTDQVLEVLFRMAVTAAKKVKTQIPLSKGNISAIGQAIEELKGKGYHFSDKKCLVIGNGEMGKLTAQSLRKEGADVTVTVRQYRSGVVLIPEGCSRINYGERLEMLPVCDFIVSATASPNLTLHYDDVKHMHFQKLKIFVDLAVPRDIDQRIQTMENVQIINIDQLQLDPELEGLKEKIALVNQLLQEQIQEFISWYECREVIPKVQVLCKHAGEDVTLRLTKTMKQLPMTELEKNELEKHIAAASSKVVNKLMFGIRDLVDVETFRICMEAMEGLYE